jgi:hypothetical protein
MVVLFKGLKKYLFGLESQEFSPKIMLKGKGIKKCAVMKLRTFWLIILKMSAFSDRIYFLHYEFINVIPVKSAFPAFRNS